MIPTWHMWNGIQVSMLHHCQPFGAWVLQWNAIRASNTVQCNDTIAWMQDEHHLLHTWGFVICNVIQNKSMQYTPMKCQQECKEAMNSSACSNTVQYNTYSNTMRCKGISLQRCKYLPMVSFLLIPRVMSYSAVKSGLGTYAMLLRLKFCCNLRAFWKAFGELTTKVITLWKSSQWKPTIRHLTQSYFNSKGQTEFLWSLKGCQLLPPCSCINTGPWGIKCYTCQIMADCCEKLCSQHIFTYQKGWQTALQVSQ